MRKIASRRKNGGNDLKKRAHTAVTKEAAETLGVTWDTWAIIWAMACCCLRAAVRSNLGCWTATSTRDVNGLLATSLLYPMLPLGELVLEMVTSGGPRYISLLVTIGFPEVIPPWRCWLIWLIPGLDVGGGGVLLGGDRLLAENLPSEAKKTCKKKRKRSTLECTATKFLEL